MLYDTEDSSLCQALIEQRREKKDLGYDPKDVLCDKSATGKERPWQAKKEANVYLSEAYLGVDVRKVERLCKCAKRLTFKAGVDGLKAHHFDSCRVRLCPVCSWRRSLKTFSNMMKVIEGMEKERQYGYIHLRLSVQNCKGEDLSKTIDAMMKGWQRFTQRKAIRDRVKGWYRALEVTHQITRRDKWYDTYHPHFHCVLAVNKSYFTGRDYMKKASWIRLWREAMRLDYDPDIYIKRIKEPTPKAIAEVTKYSVKDGDFIIPNDWELTVETVAILDSALANRRLVAYGGLMADWHKKLNLDDDEDGDLIHVDDTEPGEETDNLVVYAWHTGYWQYFREY